MQEYKTCFSFIGANHYCYFRVLNLKNIEQGLKTGMRKTKAFDHTLNYCCNIPAAALSPDSQQCKRLTRFAPVLTATAQALPCSFCA